MVLNCLGDCDLNIKQRIFSVCILVFYLMITDAGLLMLNMCLLYIFLIIENFKLWQYSRYNENEIKSFVMWVFFNPQNHSEIRKEIEKSPTFLCQKSFH